MSKKSLDACGLDEEQLDLLLREHCEELAEEPVPAQMRNLAARLEARIRERQEAFQFALQESAFFCSGLQSQKQHAQRRRNSDFYHN